MTKTMREEKGLNAGIERWKVELSGLIYDMVNRRPSNLYHLRGIIPNFKDIEELIENEMKQQLQLVFEEIEKTRKTESVIRQAEVAMKNKNYSLMQIRYIVKGYNKAIKDVLSLRQKYISGEKEEK